MGPFQHCHNNSMRIGIWQGLERLPALFATFTAVLIFVTNIATDVPSLVKTKDEDGDIVPWFVDALKDGLFYKLRDLLSVTTVAGLD